MAAIILHTQKSIECDNLLSKKHHGIPIKSVPLWDIWGKTDITVKLQLLYKETFFFIINDNRNSCTWIIVLNNSSTLNK